MKTTSVMGANAALPSTVQGTAAAPGEADAQAVAFGAALERSDTAIDWKQAVQNALRDLRGRYGNTTLLVESSGTVSRLKDYAEQLGTGNYLVVSQKFLDQMAAGSQSFQNGFALLEQVMGQLSKTPAVFAGAGAYLDEKSLTYWVAQEKTQPSFSLAEKTQPQKTLSDWMKEAKEKAEKLRESMRVKVNASMYQQPAQIYSRLAQAKTVQNVNHVVYTARNRIHQLKRSMSSADDKDREKIRAVISQLEGSIARARRKTSSLREEELLKRRQKRAEQEHRTQRAKGLEYTLQRRKTARAAGEYAQVSNSAVWGLMMAEQARRRQIEEYRGAQQAAAAVGAAPTMPSAATVAGAGAAAAPEVSVTVSAPVSISISA